MTATTPLLERDSDSVSSAEDVDPDVHHHYHCDPDVAWCGEDLSDVEECPLTLECVICPLCELAWESDVCPVCDAVEVR